MRREAPGLLCHRSSPSQGLLPHCSLSSFQRITRSYTHHPCPANAMLAAAPPRVVCPSLKPSQLVRSPATGQYGCTDEDRDGARLDSPPPRGEEGMGACTDFWQLFLTLGAGTQHRREACLQNHEALPCCPTPAEFRKQVEDLSLAHATH